MYFKKKSNSNFIITLTTIANFSLKILVLRKISKKIPHLNQKKKISGNNFYLKFINLKHCNGIAFGFLSFFFCPGSRHKCAKIFSREFFCSPLLPLFFFHFYFFFSSPGNMILLNEIKQAVAFSLDDGLG